MALFIGCTVAALVLCWLLGGIWYVIGVIATLAGVWRLWVVFAIGVTIWLHFSTGSENPPATAAVASVHAASFHWVRWLIVGIIILGIVFVTWCCQHRPANVVVAVDVPPDAP